ncbi:MAG: cupin domain-containing protein [Oscillospiraceae bacterium]|jgi:mannose-6-phosphate isomerase-like protein (cupin superfamily)|nr:cupin domain-containing protein [Oscillospiraceae bacterium]
MKNNTNSNQLAGADYGPEPFVTNLKGMTCRNNYFRKALWTGENLQITLMCIEPGESIGLEVHPDVDQCLIIEQGVCCAVMGNSSDKLNHQVQACGGCAVCVPAGTWHNLINTGCCPLKLCAIYAPPEHPAGTAQCTKAEAEAAEETKYKTLAESKTKPNVLAEAETKRKVEAAAESKTRGAAESEAKQNLLAESESNPNVLAESESAKK